MARQRVGRQVVAAPGMVDRDVLPEIDQLQRAAHRVALGQGTLAVERSERAFALHDEAQRILGVTMGGRGATCARLLLAVC